MFTAEADFQPFQLVHRWRYLPWTSINLIVKRSVLSCVKQLRYSLAISWSSTPLHLVQEPWSPDCILIQIPSYSHCTARIFPLNQHLITMNHGWVPIVSYHLDFHSLYHQNWYIWRWWPGWSYCFANIITTHSLHSLTHSSPIAIICSFYSRYLSYLP